MSIGLGRAKERCRSEMLHTMLRMVPDLCGYAK
jgi:hypothetical protein